MSAPRKISFSAILLAAYLATSYALPAQTTVGTSNDASLFPTLTPDEFEGDFFGFPFFKNLFKPFWELFPGFNSVTPSVDVNDQRALISVRLNDYKVEDIKVKIRNNVLSIQGDQESKKDNQGLFARSFFFSQPIYQANATAEDATAQFTSDGWLLVTIPFNGASKSENEVIVPITETKAPYEPPKTEKPDVVRIDNDKNESTTAKKLDDTREATTDANNISDNEVLTL